MLKRIHSDVSKGTTNSFPNVDPTSQNRTKFEGEGTDDNEFTTSNREKSLSEVLGTILPQQRNTLDVRTRELKEKESLEEIERFYDNGDSIDNNMKNKMIEASKSAWPITKNKIQEGLEKIRENRESREEGRKMLSDLRRELSDCKDANEAKDCWKSWSQKLNTLNDKIDKLDAESLESKTLAQDVLDSNWLINFFRG